jgi:hypothetical protein
MDLYHADIRLPEGFRLPARIVGLHWTRHAESARLDDRYGRIPKFGHIDLRFKEVIEVGLTGRKVEKVVVRGSLDETFDIVYVLIPNGHAPWTVKTVWINEKTDTHSTLDRSRYVC